ncbi:MAG: DUF1517 domain-containing protein [Deltaproteobacteria bacterium]|nr:DUF1517 domain-containing protein [Deltaproteobacteria bacterium]
MALVFVGLAILLPSDGTPWCPAPAAAQSTGGSFGGGSFGGGGGGGGGSYGGGGSWGGGGSSYGGGGSLSPSMTCLLFVVFLVVFGISKLIGKSAGGSEPQYLAGAAPSARSPLWGNMDVTAISLALDARARPFVQDRLAKLARSGATGTPGGLARLCREAASLLLSVERAWLYAGAKNYRPMSPPQAESGFRGLATDYRSRFRHEVVRAEGGQLRAADAPEQRARAEEGEGVVVVTLIVAARCELLDLTNARDAGQIRLALTALSQLTTRQLVALEVVWSPAEENDRMSTAELEPLYPELGKLDESTMAGRIFCPSCHAPYAAELPRCPHCGAPRPTTPGA